jgi:hypothetical protein
LPEELDPDGEIVKQILSYFVRNPQAVDSVEGIARWRLLEEQIHRTVKQSQVALDWLAANGYLDEVCEAGSQRLFRLNAQRHADAATFLAGKEPGKKQGGEHGSEKPEQSQSV